MMSTLTTIVIAISTAAIALALSLFAFYRSDRRPSVVRARLHRPADPGMNALYTMKRKTRF